MTGLLWLRLFVCAAIGLCACAGRQRPQNDEISVRMTEKDEAALGRQAPDAAPVPYGPKR